MEFPIELKELIENKIKGLNKSHLKSDAQNISERYRYASGQGKRLLTLENEALVYSLVRMPATYGAISEALSYTLELIDDIPRTLVDVGAGTGAGSFAADCLIHLNQVTCLEREQAMMNIGQSLMKDYPGVLKDATWKQFDLTKDVLPQGDLVVISYVLNELDEVSRKKAVEKLFNATHKVLLIVEPGTPVAYQNLMQIRSQLLSLGANIIAPCPHENKCPLSKDDWCHFTTRIQRSSLHKQLKSGDAPYEDEKFSFLAITKQPISNSFSRVLRHPYYDKGKVSLKLCTPQGIVNQEVKKREGQLYKKARKVKCGDLF